MAKSKFEYVRYFEQENACLKNCWIVVRIDGKNFHKFAEVHNFEKPNDLKALNLMTKSATSVFEEFKDVTLAFGQSDEYSFIFKKNTSIFNRRTEKILSLVCSVFSSAYAFYWQEYFSDKKLQYPPAFDGRIVLYPTDYNLRDYLSWRQADVHVNNLYNTCFWSLVLKKGLSTSEAEEKLRGTLSSHKNELLFQEFGINYNNEPAAFRKGTVLIRKCLNTDKSNKKVSIVVPLHCDIIKDEFWIQHNEILEQSGTVVVEEGTLEKFYLVNQRDFLKSSAKKAAKEKATS